MTQSQAAKGNVTVTNYKRMNVIRSNAFKLKASVDVLNVVPVNKKQTCAAGESMQLLFPDVFSCVGGLLTLGPGSASVYTDHSSQLIELVALGQCAI